MDLCRNVRWIHLSIGTPIQHHHTCDGRKKPHLSCFTHPEVDCKLFCRTTVPVSSSCSSTFPVRIVNKYILWRDGEVKTCQQKPSFIRASAAMWHRVHPWVCCTSISANAVLWFPHGQSEELNSPPEMFVCVSISHTVNQGMPVNRSVELCCCFTTTRRETINPGESGKMCYLVIKMWTLTWSYKAVKCTLYNVNRMVIYFLLCCVYGNFLIRMEWSFIFYQKVLKCIALYFSLLWDCFLFSHSEVSFSLEERGFIWRSREFSMDYFTTFAVSASYCVSTPPHVSTNV